MKLLLLAALLAGVVAGCKPAAVTCRDCEAADSCPDHR